MAERIEPSLTYTPFEWSLTGYHEAIAAGVFTASDKVELLYGKIIPRSPVGRFHAVCVDKISTHFTVLFHQSYSMRCQNPVSMLDHSEPEPDFVIARLNENSYAEGHPTGADIQLFIEVSDSTLDKDRHYKLPLYSADGVPEYWIVNLVDRQFEVFTQPTVEGNYLQSKIYLEGEIFEHPRFGKIDTAQLLPSVKRAS